MHDSHSRQTTLYIRQRLVQRAIADCSFINLRLKIIKYMMEKFLNAEKLNIRG
jgi:hypothetical protein